MCSLRVQDAAQMAYVCPLAIFIDSSDRACELWSIILARKPIKHLLWQVDQYNLHPPQQGNSSRCTIQKSCSLSTSGYFANNIDEVLSCARVHCVIWYQVHQFVKMSDLLQVVDGFHQIAQLLGVLMLSPSINYRDDFSGSFNEQLNRQVA
jgi:hypothetical protein